MSESPTALASPSSAPTVFAPASKLFLIHEVSYLVGYYGDEGAVPVAALQAVLDGQRATDAIAGLNGGVR